MELFGCEKCFKLLVVSITKATVTRELFTCLGEWTTVAMPQRPHITYLTLEFPFDHIQITAFDLQKLVEREVREIYDREERKGKT